jgi:peptide chain release factor 1
MEPNSESGYSSISIEKKLDEIQKDYKKYIKIVTSGDKSSPEFKNAVVKLGEMEEIIHLKNKRDTLNKNIAETEELLKGEETEIHKLAEDEINKFVEEKSHIDKRVREILAPEKTEDVKNAIVELRAGIGGEEASLFVRDLFRMYSRFCEKKGYGVEILSTRRSSTVGFKEVIFLVKGRGAYGDFKYEGGVHRVQRVPDTENYGRIHTSATTAAVFPETEEKEMRIDPGDIRIETFRSSGAGGQSVNKTSSAVRIIHIPTGMVISCQDERSQIQNKIKGMKILRARLRNLYESDKKSKIDSERREAVKTGKRSEKIRTYNFPQNRLTDHRVELTLYNLDRIMEGEMETMIKTLRERLKNEKE